MTSNLSLWSLVTHRVVFGELWRRGCDHLLQHSHHLPPETRWQLFHPKRREEKEPVSKWLFRFLDQKWMTMLPTNFLAFICSPLYKKSSFVTWCLAWLEKAGSDTSESTIIANGGPKTISVATWSSGDCFCLVWNALLHYDVSLSRIESRGWKILFLAENYGFQKSRKCQNEASRKHSCKFLTHFGTAEPTSLQFAKVAPTSTDWTH